MKISVVTFTLISLTASLISTFANADIAKDLNNFFEATGNGVNVTKGGAYQGQAGGHYTGGGIYTRGNIKNTEIFNIQPPSFRAGCGGIDLYTGGFSYIDSKQMVDTMKAIGANATSYAFSIAMQTMAPQVKGAVDYLYDVSQEINGMNINSCEMSAQLLGGVLPKSEAANEVLCQHIGVEKGIFSDFAQGRQQCGKGKKAESLILEDEFKKHFGDTLGGEYNLIWKALMKNKFLYHDKELAEFFMSVTGTAIVRIEDDQKKNGDTKYITEYKKSFIKNQNLLDAIIDGKQELEIYKCDNYKECLRPEIRKVKIEKGLIEKTEKMMRELASKVRNGGKLQSHERSFIESTDLPIFKILAVQLAFNENRASIGLSEYSSAISHDILLKYLEEVLDIAEASLKELNRLQLQENEINEMISEVRHAKKEIQDKRYSAFQKMEAVISATRRAMQTESQLLNMSVTESNIIEEGK